MMVDFSGRIEERVKNIFFVNCKCRKVIRQVFIVPLHQLLRLAWCANRPQISYLSQLERTSSQVKIAVMIVGFQHSEYEIIE